MFDENVRRLVVDQMVEAGIISETGMCTVVHNSGREYLVSVVLFDVSGWDEKTPPA